MIYLYLYRCTFDSFISLMIGSFELTIINNKWTFVNFCADTCAALYLHMYYTIHTHVLFTEQCLYSGQRWSGPAGQINSCNKESSVIQNYVMLYELPLCYSCLQCISEVIYKYTQIWDFGSAPRSRTSQATAWEDCGHFHIWHFWRECVASLLWAWDQDGPLYCTSAPSTQ